jgi:hypothetical protein
MFEIGDYVTYFSIKERELRRCRVVGTSRLDNEIQITSKEDEEEEKEPIVGIWVSENVVVKEPKITVF